MCTKEFNYKTGPGVNMLCAGPKKTHYNNNNNKSRYTTTVVYNNIMMSKSLLIFNFKSHDSDNKTCCE